MATYIQTRALENVNKSFSVEHGNFFSFWSFKTKLSYTGAMWTVKQHAWTREEALERHRFSTPVRLATTKEVCVLIFLYHFFDIFERISNKKWFWPECGRRRHRG